MESWNFGANISRKKRKILKKAEKIHMRKNYRKDKFIVFKDPHLDKIVIYLVYFLFILLCRKAHKTKL